MSKTILVTGSLGFILGHFIRKSIYNKVDFNLVSIDKAVSPKTLHRIYVNRQHQFYLGDITDKHFLDRVFQKEKPDIVLHGAAESFVDSAISDATPFINSNILGTQNIVDACLKYKVEKLIYTSTDEIYGQHNNDTDKWTESSPLAPRNPYSASKAAGEMIITAAHHTHGLNYNITRSCNNFGSWQLTRNFIPKIVKSIINNQKIPVYGEGKEVREWLYVEDNCNALMTIINGPANEIFNIGTGWELSNLELVHQICNILNTGHNLVEFVNNRPGHDYRYSVDSNKIRKLGWKPEHKFKKSLEETVNWYKLNTWWLKD